MGDQESYIANHPFAKFIVLDIHLFKIFAPEPQSSEIDISPTIDGLINFGILVLLQN